MRTLITIAALTFCSTFCLYGQTLPSFNLISMQGDTISSEALKGKLVYINIWETWCGPCVSEIPTLNKVREKYPETIFLALTPASKPKTKQFLKKHSFNFPVICDADDLVKKLLQTGYPTHVLVDRFGKITYVPAKTTVSYSPANKPSQKELARLIQEANYEKLDRALTANKLK